MTTKYILRGFISIPSLANNEVGKTSAIGELSSQSETCAIEKGYYHDATKPNVELVSFTSHNEYDDPSRKPTPVEVPANYANFILSVSQWAYTQALDSAYGSDVEIFRKLLLAQFNQIAECEVGELEVSNGTWLPSYIRFKYHFDNSTNNMVHIWFSDAAFFDQYPDTEIIVVSSILPVDTFQLARNKVLEALATFTLPKHHEALLERTKNIPFTYPVSKVYKWHDRDDADFTAPTNWTVAIYGRVGNNPTLIKKAIADYILANSNFSLEDWIPVFPDIFTTTEFSIVPLWNRIGIIDETPRGSLYSPIVPYNWILPFAEKHIKYPARPQHVLKNLEITGVQYKSLALFVCGGTENKDNKFKFSEWFPTYAVTSSQSIDFERMGEYTVNFVRLLINGLIIAEDMDEYTYVPERFARVVKKDKMYVCFEYDDVLYLIMTKKTLLAQEAK